MSIFSKIFNNLKKARQNFGELISKIFNGELNDEFFEELEYVLIASDMGVKATSEIIESIKKDAKSKKIKTKKDFDALLKEHLVNLLTFEEQDLSTPLLIAFVGVNGVGKTTAIGRLSNYFKKQGKQVLTIAGDTFRAGATEQLTEWATKTQVRIVKYSQGADPGAVVYDGIASAIAKKDDVVLVDTAGRLHTKVNLMDELKKIYKIIDSQWEDRNFKNYIVIDATTGQNALTQVKMFSEVHKIDGIILTKLDGTAKGGIVFAIAKEFNIPVVFIGTGEGMDDIHPFNAKEFVDALI